MNTINKNKLEELKLKYYGLYPTVKNEYPNSFSLTYWTEGEELKLNYIYVINGEEVSRGKFYRMKK